MEYLDDLVNTVALTYAKYLMVSDAAASQRPGPNKWSAKEIIGHLIDSAANNHQRFVRARWQPNMVFSGYDQDDWVVAQDYQSAPWLDLLEFWRVYNLHLARVMRGYPEDARLAKHREHNLDQLAWREVPATEPVSMDYFMADYVDHLRHHVAQLDALGLIGPA